MEGDWEVVKRFGRDESIWVVIPLYMEAMIGISVLLSLSQLAKTLSLSYFCLCLFFNKIGEKGRTGREARGWEGEVECRGQGEKWPKQCMHI
jgi:hypothetical protein